MSAAFVIHMLVNKLMSIPLFQHQILVSYAINTALAVGVFGAWQAKKSTTAKLAFFFSQQHRQIFGVFSILRSHKADGKLSY